jgi:hypothetical protein
MRYILILAGSLWLMSCSNTYQNKYPLGETFPNILGNSLKGREYKIPEDFSGEKILLLIGFKRKTQFDIDRWAIGLDQTNARVRTIELPTTQGWFPIVFNDMIDNGMRKGIPDELWKDVITVYNDGEIVQRFTGNENPLNCRVILLGAAGKVEFFYDRGFSVSALNELRLKI